MIRSGNVWSAGRGTSSWWSLLGRRAMMSMIMAIITLTTSGMTRGGIEGVMGQSSYSISSYETKLDLSSPTGLCDMTVTEWITIRPSVGAVLSTFTRTINYPIYATSNVYMSSTPTVSSVSDSNARLSSMVTSSTNDSVVLTLSFTSTANAITLLLTYTVSNVARTYDDDTYVMRSLWYPYNGWNVPLTNANITIIIPSYATAPTFAATTLPVGVSSNTDSGILQCNEVSSTSLISRSLYCGRHSVSTSLLSSVLLQMTYSPSSSRARYQCSSYELASSLISSPSSTAVRNAVGISFGVLGACFVLTGLCILRHKYRDDIDACCEPCNDCR
jgi:hypothetical protein